MSRLDREDRPSDHPWRPERSKSRLAASRWCLLQRVGNSADRAASIDWPGACRNETVFDQESITYRLCNVLKCLILRSRNSISDRLPERLVRQVAHQFLNTRGIRVGRQTGTFDVARQKVPPHHAEHETHFEAAPFAEVHGHDEAIEQQNSNRNLKIEDSRRELLGEAGIDLFG